MASTLYENKLVDQAWQARIHRITDAELKQEREFAVAINQLDVELNQVTWQQLLGQAEQNTSFKAHKARLAMSGNPQLYRVAELRRDTPRFKRVGIGYQHNEQRRSDEL